MVAKIKAAGEARHSRDLLKLMRKPPASVALSARQTAHSVPTIIALGISTGGPKALQEILPDASGRPSSSNPGRAAYACRLHRTFCQEAEQPLYDFHMRSIAGEVIQPGVVYIAPAGSHMTVDRPISSRMLICLSDKTDNQPHVPSVDITMQSVASAFHSQAMGIIMTGMGADGAQGMKRHSSRRRFHSWPGRAELCRLRHASGLRGDGNPRPGCATLADSP